MRCSICVNTHKRPQMLADLLQSLIDQQEVDELALEIIVVDNDPAGSGRVVVEPFASKSPIPIHYHHEPIKNISLARNKAVTAATGDYILFIDDDEAADPLWVSMMLKTLLTYEADAVFGRVRPIFHDAAPDWIKNIYLYHKACEPTGTVTYTGRTSNALVKASWLRRLEGPFDPAYGSTGGEDSHLFHRMALQGAKFVTCFEGVVTEFMPPERTEPEWLRRRAMRMGMIYVRRTIALAQMPLLTRLMLLIKSIGQLIVSILLSVLSFSNQYRRLHWRLKTAAYSGHILAVFGKRMVGY